MRLSARSALGYFRRQFSASAGDAPVLVSNTSNVRTVTLNRPKALNALNLEMIEIMDPEVNDDCSALILDGAGKAFCAGGDVVAVTHAGRDGDRSDPKNLSRTFFYNEYQMDYKIATLQAPTVALMDGFTMGGGVGLSINADIRVATSQTLFAMPETSIGLFCDVGGTYFLPRLPGKLGTYLALAGTRLSGEDCMAVGVATHYIDSPNAQAIASRLSELPSIDLASVTESLDELNDTAAQSRSVITEERIGTIDRLFAGNTVEDIMIALENDKSGEKWVAQALKSMKAASPLSLKLVLEQMRRGPALDLAGALELEYRLAQHVMDEGDFYEGVRALLIDKDKSPKWIHSRLEDVSDELVQHYFSNLDPKDELVLKAK